MDIHAGCCFSEAVTHENVGTPTLDLPLLESLLGLDIQPNALTCDNLSSFVILGLTMLSRIVITAEVEAKAAGRSMTAGHLHMMHGPKQMIHNLWKGGLMSEASLQQQFCS